MGTDQYRHHNAKQNEQRVEMYPQWSDFKERYVGAWNARKQVVHQLPFNSITLSMSAFSEPC